MGKVHQVTETSVLHSPGGETGTGRWRSGGKEACVRCARRQGKKKVPWNCPTGLGRKKETGHPTSVQPTISKKKGKKDRKKK